MAIALGDGKVKNADVEIDNETLDKSLDSPSLTVPAVSVVIPCFNQGQYLPESTGSVLDQTITDWEIVVVDDGSTDPGTLKVLEHAQHPKMRVVRSANQGLAAARNLGISHATGRYILPLDCDDRIAPTYLEKAVARLDADPGLGIVYCQAEFFGSQTGRWNLPPYEFPRSIFEPAIFCSGVFRRADWQECGGYNRDMRHGYEDHDFWLSLISRGRRVLQLEEVLFFYRRTPGSMAQAITLDQQVESFMAMFRHHRNLFIDHIETLFRGFISRESLAQVRHMRPMLQVFPGGASGYSEPDSVRSEYAAGGWIEVSLPLSGLRAGEVPLRLDPGMQTGCYDIAEVHLLRDGTIVSSWHPGGNGEDGAAVAGTAFVLPGDRQILRVFSFGPDPQIILPGLRLAAGASSIRVKLRYLPGIEPAAEGFAALRATGRF